MRIAVVLVSLCFLLASCATTLSGEEGTPSEVSPQTEVSPPVPLPTEVTHETHESQEPVDLGSPNLESQAAAPETSASGLDTFYASEQQSPGVDQVAPETQVPPTILPEKIHLKRKYFNVDSSYEDQKPEKPAYKKSKNLAKKRAKVSKRDKNKIAKN
ncbi:MAG TPA: hypothetical protein VIG33_13200, partial [Pseudobdellovibrionaceae bacterium]